MAKVRYQMFLEAEQKEALEKIQRDSNIPVAEIVRKAIDRFLSEWREKKGMPEEDEVVKRLLSVAGICKGGPKDLADNHDKYLYGPGRK
jgi:hypothetical protein